MKTIKILFFAAVLLSGVSCTKEETQPIPPMTGNDDVPSFVALGSQVESKVSLMENGTSVNWAVGDLVAVADGSGDIYKFASEGDGTNAIFRYQTAGEQECMFNKSADKYLMAYPWAASVTIDMESNTVTSSLPAVQSAVKGNFEGSYAVAVAVGNDIETPFAFKCAVSMLKVEIPEALGGKVAELVVRGNQGEDLAGDLVITCTEDGPVTELGTQKDSEVRLVSENGVLEPGTYYIAIAPVTVSKGISVAAVSAENFTEFEISTAKEEKTFMPGYIYNLGALNAEKIEFPAGLGRLPYVFPLFASAGTGNNPKYVTKKVVTAKKEFQLTDASTGAVFTAKTTGGGVDYWSNKWYGQDNVYGLYFTNQDTYYMLSVPLKMSLPSAFKVSFGFFIDGTKNDIIKDWKVQYSKDNQTWYDGADFELQRILKYYSVEIAPEVTFEADDVLYLRWIPTGNTGWDGETTGQNGQIHFSSGVVISEVTGPDSDASGNVYAEDFDRMSGGVDYRHAGQANGIEKLGLLGEVFGEKINTWTDEKKNGLSGSNVAERPGYAQIGFATYKDDNRNGAGTNQVGSLVTPVLEKASGTVTLSFKAMCYRSPFIGRAAMSAAAQTDVTDIVVKIKGAGSFTPASNVTSKTLSGISTNKFDVQTLTIYNADETTQIEFTSTAVNGKFTRWFIDDICVNR
ncbi:MAG: hypothetical protein E7115_05050 [Bacteroidales bacterium]|nr:hypothetical protein [Bacteroidales bacterium]